MKLPFPRSVKAWLVASVSLVAVTLVSIAPLTRPRAQNPPTTYTITDLGTLGGAESKAFGINGCGQIAGYATNAGSAKRPFFRPAGTLIDLGVWSGDGLATSLNNSGSVVGYSPITGSTKRAFIWHDDNGNNADDPGERKQLLPDGASGVAEDINDNGRVVGWVDSGIGDTLGYSAYIWDPNQTPNFQIIDGSPAFSSLLAYGINNAGTIVGEDSDITMGFILRNGTFTSIPAFAPGTRSTAYAVSEADHVVGKAATTTSGDFIPHAFIWTDAAGVKDLGTLTGKTRSIAYNVAIVSNAVQVVGTSYSNDLSDGRAFVWQDLDNNGVSDPNEMKYLWDMIPADDQANWTVLQEARSINSSGQIVGFGTKNGQTHAFLLTPPSGPPSACLPTVNVSVSPAAVNEDPAASLTYTFTRSIVTGSPLTVNFTTVDSTAAANDYGISSVGSVQIPANMATGTVTVTPIADMTDEANETVVLRITDAGSGYTIGSPNTATGTITDNDDAPTIQITSVTAPEPNAGAVTSFVFTVSLTNSSSSPITVNYATSTTGATTPATGGTDCNPGIDFVHGAGGLTFSAGETSKQVGVTVCGDSSLEPDEIFFVNLSGNSANSVLPPDTKGTGTITPQAPTVFTEEGNGNFAVAIDSVTFVRGPFRLTNEWNFTPNDRRTRVILVTTPLGMTQADLGTGILTVNIAGYANPLPIENVGPITGVAGLNASFIIVRLPEDLQALNPAPGPNNLTLTVKMGSATSNATLLSIKP